MSLFQNMLAQMEDAGELLQLTADAKLILGNPERILFVTIPVRMDSGEIRVLKGIVYSTAPFEDQQKTPLFERFKS